LINVDTFKYPWKPSTEVSQYKSVDQFINKHSSCQ